MLVSLGSACPAAPTACIPAGHVLPSPWPHSASSGAGGALPAGMLSPGGGGGRASSGLYFVGGGSAAIVTAATHASGGGGTGVGGGGGIGVSVEARSSMRSAMYSEMGVMTWLVREESEKGAQCVKEHKEK